MLRPPPHHHHFPAHPGGPQVLPVILPWGLGTLTKPSNSFFVYILTCFVVYGILYSPFTVVSVLFVGCLIWSSGNQLPIGIHPSINSEETELFLAWLKNCGTSHLSRLDQPACSLFLSPNSLVLLGVPD